MLDIDIRKKQLSFDRDALDFAVNALSADDLRAYLYFYSYTQVEMEGDVSFNLDEIDEIYTLSKSATQKAIRDLIKLRYLRACGNDRYRFYSTPQFEKTPSFKNLIKKYDFSSYEKN